MSQPPSLRRIVTGHNDQGVAVVASDITIDGETMDSGIKGRSIWITDRVPAHDNNNSEDGATRPIGDPSNFELVHPKGTNFRFTDLSPGHIIPMHRTSSVDYNVLVFGELILITEDGAEKHLSPGDVVVQKGTIHAWKNPSSTTWARLVSVLIPAEPAVVQGKPLDPAFIPLDSSA
ncbi:hypothetical protein M378DRAFT_67085 [Amanita muscaria Koide BX008]|uniref:Cupin type-2 domain-containing protein n=1 Tax=Amanita muscaria (strain Koide BX008) TaxID=946122 RepID=A0A0C2X903_AMAMK|nr:hypothetical protein M378DRAFT_67085 [Amanita muscaria Koide BX008]